MSSGSIAVSAPSAQAECTIALVTPHAPGAVAMLQLTGNVVPLLVKLTGAAAWPVGKLSLRSIAGVDDGLVVRIKDDMALLMPHGGLRVVHRIAEAAVALGATLVRADDVHPISLYPEARDLVEACMLAAVAKAESPLAIDLLLDQPRRWRNAPALTDADRARSRRLNRLITPPVVVLAGLPNVGKSTLTNALVGRSLSITADMPGTTRDYTAGRIDVAGLVVDWHDTPGIRESDDPIEQRAIAIATKLLAHADLIIAMSAPGIEWPALPRPADLHVINKCDLIAAPSLEGVSPLPATKHAEAASDESARKTRVPAANDSISSNPAAPIPISARTGKNLAHLAAAIRESFVPQADIDHPGPWLFDERLLGDRSLR